MKLDGTFAREVRRAANGDGSREARLLFLGAAKAARKDLSTPKVKETFSEALKKHGRPAVSVCVAATVVANADRLEPATVRWGRAVMELWKNRGPRSADSVVIDDGLHPTSIEIYAGGLIRATTLEN